MFCRALMLSLGILLFGAVSETEAKWTQTESQTELSIVPGVAHQHVVLSDGRNEATLELVKFSPKSARLNVLDNPNGRTLAEAVDPKTAAAGVNGGYFDVNFAPL